MYYAIFSLSLFSSDDNIVLIQCLPYINQLSLLVPAGSIIAILHMWKAASWPENTSPAGWARDRAQLLETPHPKVSPPWSPPLSSWWYKTIKTNGVTAVPHRITLGLKSLGTFLKALLTTSPTSMSCMLSLQLSSLLSSQTVCSSVAFLLLLLKYKDFLVLLCKWVTCCRGRMRPSFGEAWSTKILLTDGPRSPGLLPVSLGISQGALTCSFVL